MHEFTNKQLTCKEKRLEKLKNLPKNVPSEGGFNCL